MKVDTQPNVADSTFKKKGILAVVTNCLFDIKITNSQRLKSRNVFKTAISGFFFQRGIFLNNENFGEKKILSFEIKERCLPDIGHV